MKSTGKFLTRIHTLLVTGALALGCLTFLPVNTSAQIDPDQVDWDQLSEDVNWARANLSPAQWADAVSTAESWTDDIRQSLGISAADWHTFVRLVSEGRIEEAVAFLEGLLGPVSVAQPTPASPTVLMVQQTMVSSIFKMDVPAGREGGEDTGDLRLVSSFGAGGDLFYDQSETKGGTKIKTYGGYISGSIGKRFSAKATIPIYQTEAGSMDRTTYGLDINLKYKVIDADRDVLGLGVHGGMLGFSGDTSDDYLGMGGPYVGYTHRFDKTFSVSLGTVADYIGPETSDSTWLWAAGVQIGIRLGQKVALNPFYIYSRDLDVNYDFDPDWHDVGLQISIDLARTWTLGFGAKTSLGYDPLDSNWQVFLGTAWRF